MSKPTIPPQEVRDRLRSTHAQDPEMVAILAALDRAEHLLHRSLYEFGSEIRSEIKTLLGTDPLLPRS